VVITRGELSYLAPLGSEKISAPYFKLCFFRGEGWVLYCYLTVLVFSWQILFLLS
jgi:hypothetical protein